MQKALKGMKRDALKCVKKRLDEFKSGCHLQMNPQSRKALGILFFVLRNLQIKNDIS